MSELIQKRYEMGRDMMRHREFGVAIDCLEKNLADNGRHALSLSLLGSVLSRSGKDVKRGIKLCNKAIELESHNAVHYVRLADIYRRRNRKRKIIQILKEGLVAMPGNMHLQKLLDSFGKRKSPLFPFLERSNPVNKFVGRLSLNNRRH